MPVTVNRPRFQAVQYAFTRHMRDPEHTDAPADVEDRRVEIYRGLLYRNVEGFIAGSYPVLRKITPDDQWHAMLRDYFKRHQSRTPLFPKMPQEFLQYLEKERNNSDDPPFMLELAHYEWIELALNIDTREIEMDGIDPDGDLLEELPVLNPLYYLLSYRFPVHRISPDYKPLEAPEQPTYLAVFRNRKDKVGFFELNPVSARLLELIEKNTISSGREALESIAAELQHPDPAVVISGGLDIMQKLLEKEILLGTVVNS